MTANPGRFLLVSDLRAPVRPSDLHRLARRRLHPLVPPGFPLDDALIGLDEAYTNILEHAFGRQESPSLLVEAFWDLRGLNFVLSDRGSRGPSLAFPRDRGASSEDLRRRAVASGGRLGLYLIRRIMDCICYEISPRGTNSLSLVKFPPQENRMEEELLVELREEAGLTRVTVKGYVNMDTSDYLAEKIRAFVEREGLVRILLDVRDLDYVSSSGVGVFIDLFDRYEDRGGRVCFWGLKPAVRRVLELVGFLTFFGDAADEAQAVAYLTRT